jgi:hypothetical protein
MSFSEFTPEQIRELWLHAWNEAKKHADMCYPPDWQHRIAYMRHFRNKLEKDFAAMIGEYR